MSKVATVFTAFAVLAKGRRQEKEINCIILQKKKIKLLLFEDDSCLYE
jgi:hypothetical protein